MQIIDNNKFNNYPFICDFLFNRYGLTYDINNSKYMVEGNNGYTYEINVLGNEIAVSCDNALVEYYILNGAFNSYDNPFYFDGILINMNEMYLINMIKNDYDNLLINYGKCLIDSGKTVTDIIKFLKKGHVLPEEVFNDAINTNKEYAGYMLNEIIERKLIHGYER